MYVLLHNLRPCPTCKTGLLSTLHLPLNITHISGAPLVSTSVFHLVHLPVSSADPQWPSPTLQERTRKHTVSPRYSSHQIQDWLQNFVVWLFLYRALLGALVWCFCSVPSFFWSVFESYHIRMSPISSAVAHGKLFLWYFNFFISSYLTCLLCAKADFSLRTLLIPTYLKFIQMWWCSTITFHFTNKLIEMKGV